MSDKKRGVPKSPEHRKKMREGQKRTEVNKILINLGLTKDQRLDIFHLLGNEEFSLNKINEVLMSKTAGLDRAVEYVQKIEKFRQALESVDAGVKTNGDTVGIDIGRKYDRIFIQTYHNGQPNQKMARYFVNRNSWEILGIKSFHQVNERRVYGTLDTVDQYDWSPFYGVPMAGTEAEKLHNEREAEIAKTHRKRGRPKKKP
jgi:hypothetical protein